MSCFRRILVWLFQRTMDAIPHVLGFIDSIFPNFIRGGTEPGPPPEVPKAVPGSSVDDDGINSIP